MDEEQNHEEYRKAVKDMVCSKCIDLGEDGQCKLSGERVCGVESHLDQMINIVKTVQSDRVEDYVNVVRTHICEHCEGQGEDGNCMYRRELDCALDRYLPLVIDAIEEIERLKG